MVVVDNRVYNSIVMDNPESESLTKWARDTGISRKISATLKEKGLRSVAELIIAVNSDKLKTMDFNLAERNRIRQAVISQCYDGGREQNQQAVNRKEQCTSIEQEEQEGEVEDQEKEEEEGEEEVDSVDANIDGEVRPLSTNEGNNDTTTGEEESVVADKCTDAVKVGSVTSSDEDIGGENGPDTTPPTVPIRPTPLSIRPPPTAPRLSTLPFDVDEVEVEEVEEGDEEEEGEDEDYEENSVAIEDDVDLDENYETEEEGSIEDVDSEVQREILERLLSTLTCVETGPPAVFKVPVTEISRCDKMAIRRCVHGKKSPYSKEMSILMIGETGSGKSTMIDAMVNHVLGVTYSDNFRFTIIDTQTEEPGIIRSSSQSQTDWITCYTIQVPYEHVDYTLNIVDTPGFNDTRGLDRDARIVDQIKELYESSEEYGLNSLDAVCFVLKASDTRVTAAKKYVLDSVLALFGKDLIDNIFILCTFSDGSKEPTLLSTLERENVKYNQVFNMNNQWLCGQPDMFSEFYWKMGIDSLHEFIKKITSIQPKSLTMSLDVLNYRKELENCVGGMQRLISSTAAHLESIQRKIDSLQGASPKIKMPTAKLIKKVSKDKNYNCQQCGITCQEACSTMDQLGIKLKRRKTKCIICECPSGKHKLQNFRFAWIRISDPFANQTTTSSLQALKDEEKRYTDAFGCQVDRMKETMRKLDDIAMRPQLNSIAEYIEIVIDKEINDQKPGWESRVEMMKEQKENYNIMHKYTTRL